MLFLTACAGSAAETRSGARPMAVATLEPKSGSKVTGSAEFTERSGAIEATISVMNAEPGQHGIHLHETGDCSSADAASAGPHFNPDGAAHGGPSHPPHHAGDLGNVEVGPEGSGTLVLHLNDVTLAAGPRSIVGRSVVVHEKADDLSTQPTGGSGSRIACGVIQMPK